MKKMIIVVLMMVVLVGMFANVGKADEWIDEDGQKWIGQTHHRTYDEFVQMAVEGSKWSDVSDEVTVAYDLYDYLKSEGYKMEVAFTDRVVDLEGYKDFVMEYRTRVWMKTIERQIEYVEWLKAGKPAGEK